MIVVPGISSYPSSVATTRPMLLPASPPGSPQPSMRSLIVVGSSSGTLSRAALMISALRSSGRKSLSEPLLARPMGERAAETITASGMWSPARVGERRVGAAGAPASLGHVLVGVAVCSCPPGTSSAARGCRAGTGPDSSGSSRTARRSTPSMAASRVRARAGLCSLPVASIACSTIRTSWAHCTWRISATVGLARSLDGQLHPHEQQVGVLQPGAQHRDGLLHDVPARHARAPRSAGCRSAMSCANCEVTYSVSRVSSASRVRMYRRAAPLGKSRLRVHGPVRQPAQAAAGHHVDRCGEQLFLPSGERYLRHASSSSSPWIPRDAGPYPAPCPGASTVVDSTDVETIERKAS